MDAGSAGGKAAPYRGDEVIGRHGLAQDAGNVDVIQRRVRAGHDHNRDVARVCVRRDLLLHGEAVESWQVQIEKDDIGGLLFENMQGGQTVLRFDHVETGESERGAIHLTGQWIVFNDEYPVIGGLLGTHAHMIAEESMNSAPILSPTVNFSR